MPPAKAKNKLIGDLGERYAIRLLRKKGLRVIDQNYHTPSGEIDIVAMDKNTLVFVEVKTRIGDKFGYPEEAITKRKLKHIVKSAYIYINKVKPRYKNIRIDVVALTVIGRSVSRCKMITIDDI